MAQIWHKTKYAGVNYREHKTRKLNEINAKDRYYCIYYRMGDKVKWEAIGWQSYGITPEKANLELADRRNSIKNGTPPVTVKQRKIQAVNKAEITQTQNILFNEYWLNTYMPKITMQYKQSSAKRTESIFNKWLLPAFANQKITEINSRHLENFYKKIFYLPLAQRTKIYIMGEMKRILRDAYYSGINGVYAPTAKEYRFLSPNNRRERVITTKEAKLILKTLQSADINAYRITKFAFLTGCRFSECAKLNHNDIFDDFIICRNTKNNTNKKIVLSNTLKKFLNKNRQENKFNLLFPDKNGNAYKQPPKIFMKIVNNLHLNNGKERLDKITFHSIRHTVATELAKTLDIRTLMDFMGWKRMEMALRYIHNNYEAAKNAAEKLQAFLD